MLNDKGKNIVIGLLLVIIIILIVLGVLIFNGNITLSNNSGDIYDKDKEEVDLNVNNSNNYVKNNLTVIPDNECASGCTKNITSVDGNKLDLYIDNDEIKLGDTSILKFEEGPYSLDQVSVYDDVIITFQGASLSSFIVIYDFNGNELKLIKIFNDEKGRTFYAYKSYSDNKVFNVSDDGIISFVGSKHVQGAVNTYLTDGGEIDLCTQGEDISDDEIVSGIFKFQYLDDYSFSEIKYVSTKEVVKDIKNCSY